MEWKKYLTDYNEGLGLVYERFVLNNFLDDLRKQHKIQSVLEAPLYGMAGVSGINDVIFAQKGVSVTMVDDNAERIEGVRRIWRDSIETTVGANSHHRPDRTCSAPSWCEPDRRLSERPIRRDAHGGWALIGVTERRIQGGSRPRA